MTERPGLSRGELEVARTLWQLGSATVRQVYEALPEVRRGDFSTVQTYLRRLQQKGYITGRMTGRQLVYSPRIKPRTVIRETLDDLIDRLFGGEAMPLLAAGDVALGELEIAEDRGGIGPLPEQVVVLEEVIVPERRMRGHQGLQGSRVFLQEIDDARVGVDDELEGEPASGFPVKPSRFITCLCRSVNRTVSGLRVSNCSNSAMPMSFVSCQVMVPSLRCPERCSKRW